MTPVGYIHIERDILTRRDLSDKSKLLYSLVRGMGSNGLTVLNPELAEILCANEKSVSRIIRDLETKKLVTIKNKQSRYRRIYCNTSVTLESDSTVTFDTPTVTLETPNCNPSVTHNKEVSNKPADSYSFMLKGGGSWGLLKDKYDEYKETYPGLDVDGEFRKAKQWCVDNPAKRKTAGGMGKFLNGWLSRAKSSQPNIEPPEMPFDYAAADECLRKVGL